MRETIQNANGKQFHAVSLSGGKDSIIVYFACRRPQAATLAFRRGVGRSAVRAGITSPG